MLEIWLVCIYEVVAELPLVLHRKMEFDEEINRTLLLQTNIIHDTSIGTSIVSMVFSRSHSHS